MTIGIFPTRLKYSQIVRIFKKGNKQELTNYRPISLLTSFSKIFEKVIYRRLYDHVTHYKILANEQYGFKNNHSTDKAIYHLTNNILKVLDDNQLVGGIFCDLTKAFDCVNHDILLAKLDFYGITGRAHKLLTSYLKNRYQRVITKKNCSSTMSESIVCVPTTTNSETYDEQPANCQLREGLSLELRKAQQKILSYEKIIQVLREELTNMNHCARTDVPPRNAFLDDQRISPTQQGGWRQVPFMARKVKSTRNSLLTTTLPTQNKFGPLTNLKEDSKLPSLIQLTKPRQIRVKNHSALKHKVLIAGDSHARDSASRLQHYLGEDYSVSSFVKPGAPMEDILKTADQLKASVKQEDILVVWGGVQIT